LALRRREAERRLRRLAAAGAHAEADRAADELRRGQADLQHDACARAALEPDSADDRALVAAAELLSRILLQDIERQQAGPALKQGVAPDRLVSVHDPEQRHGRKSRSKRFNGHKLALAVDTESQLITAVEVIPGNAPDAQGALALVEQTEAATGCAVAETIGDCAYGDGTTRQAFADAERTLVAKVPATTNQGQYPKTAFRIELEGLSCTCPAGQTTTDLTPHAAGGGHFQFAAEVCTACPERAQCTRGSGGRTVQLHPQEQLLQDARELQASPEFLEYRTERQTVEHRLARLMQLGLRQARYMGLAKTLFQACLAAAVANLTLVQAADGAASLLLVACAALAWACRGLAERSGARRWSARRSSGLNRVVPLTSHRLALLDHWLFGPAASRLQMAGCRPDF